MCKHVAAELYGVGARLDGKPELLFLLRGVNHEELIEADAEQAVAAATSRGKSKRLATASLDEVFGIQIDTAAKPSCDTPAAAPAARAVKARRLARRKPRANRQLPLARAPQRDQAILAQQNPAAGGEKRDETTQRQDQADETEIRRPDSQKPSLQVKRTAAGGWLFAA